MKNGNFKKYGCTRFDGVYGELTLQTISDRIFAYFEIKPIEGEHINNVNGEVNEKMTPEGMIQELTLTKVSWDCKLIYDNSDVVK